MDTPALIPPWQPATAPLDDDVQVLAWDGSRHYLAYRAIGHWFDDCGCGSPADETELRIGLCDPVIEGVIAWRHLDYPDGR